MDTKSIWTKHPSVTREGKYFYRNQKGHTVLQSWMTGLWSITGDKTEYKTAKAAMKSIP